MEGNWVVYAVIIVLMILVLFVMPMLNNRKRQKEVNEVFDSLSVGDEIMTIGGIMGKVIALRTHESGERLMVIETGEGENKTTMTFTIQAIRLNYTRTKTRQAELAKQKAEREAGKGEKLPSNEFEADEFAVEPEKEVEQTENANE